MAQVTADAMNPQHDLGQPFPKGVVIPSDPAEARRVQDEIEQLVRDTCHCSDKEVFSIRLALEEALVNAIKHGNQMDRGKKVGVSYRVLPERFDVLIIDEGPGFDPGDVPDPTTPENLERPCGRGVMLMRHYMTEVTYSERGNCVRMCMHRRNGTK